VNSARKTLIYNRQKVLEENFRKKNFSNRICVSKRQKAKKEKKMSDYKDLSAEQLRQLLVQKDKDLADSRKKNAENERAPQVICMAPAIPLPAPWNLKAKDTTESFRYFKRG
jgi:hypothetical protein